MNGVKRDMPLEIGSMTVVRTGDNLKLLDTTGLHISCDISNDLCSIELPGWYFGKTAGLLGTYNNEASDDLTKSDKTRARNLHEFAASWEISQKCQSSQNLATTTTSKPARCTELFENMASPLRPCFRIVSSPQSYA